MTIRVAPAASGTNTLPLRAAIPTAKVRKNAPMNSVAYFLAAIPYRGAVSAAYVGPASRVVTPAICLRSLIGALRRRLRLCPFLRLDRAVPSLAAGLVNWHHIVLMVFAPDSGVADRVVRRSFGRQMRGCAS